MRLQKLLGNQQEIKVSNDDALASLLAEASPDELQVIAETAANLPAIIPPPYSTIEYERDKYIGRRRKNGALKLKRLTARHMDIISMHLQGLSGEDIAAEKNCTVVTVSRILHDPLAKGLISLIYKNRQGEIDALAGKALEAIRDGLSDKQGIRVRLGAVDKFNKLKDTIGEGDETVKTAEDVVAAIFAGLKIEGTNVQVNIGKRDG